MNTTKQETAEEKVKVTMERERQKENLNHLLVHFRELVYQRNRLFLKKKREEKWKYTQYRIFIIKAKSKITAIQYFFFEREIENRVGIISVSYHQKKFFIVSSTAIYIFCSEGTLRNFFRFPLVGNTVTLPLAAVAVARWHSKT